MLTPPITKHSYATVLVSASKLWGYHWKLVLVVETVHPTGCSITGARRSFHNPLRLRHRSYHSSQVRFLRAAEELSTKSVRPPRSVSVPRRLGVNLECRSSWDHLEHLTPCSGRLFFSASSEVFIFPGTGTFRRSQVMSVNMLAKMISSGRFPGACPASDMIS